jgi:uncharacterized OB-fold protein
MMKKTDNMNIDCPPMAMRPRPRLTPLNRFYWEAGKENVLKIMRCQDCSIWIHPVMPVCPGCMSENVAPEVVAGTATVYSISVNYQAWAPGLEVPYTIARVVLDGVDEVLLTTNIVGDGALETTINDRVKVCFEEQEGIWFPLFTPLQEEKP